MKRNMTLKTIALCMAALLSLTAMAGCSAMKKEDITVEKFIEKKGKEQFDAIKKEVTDTFTPLLGENGKVEISVSGNEIIYNFTYGDELSDIVKESLDTNLDAMKEIFVRTAGEVKTAAEIQGEILLTVNYLDTKGEIIATRTFYSEQSEQNIVSS